MGFPLDEIAGGSLPADLVAVSGTWKIASLALGGGTPNAFTANSFGGDTLASVRTDAVSTDATAPASVTFGFVARGASFAGVCAIIRADSGLTAWYGAQIEVGSGIGNGNANIYVMKSGSVVATLSLSGVVTTGSLYKLVLTPSGSNVLHVSCLDVAANQWLTSGGTFSSGSQVTCLSYTDASSPITSAGYGGAYFYGAANSTLGMTEVTFGAATGATSYTLTAPSPATGRVGAATGNFTATPIGGSYTGAITLTPSGCGLSTPVVLTFSGSATPQTATFTPVSAGTLTVTPTASPTLGSNPAAVTATIYSLALTPGSQTVYTGVAASLTATLTGGSGSLTAATDHGTLSTTTPTSGVSFTLTDSSAEVDTVTVSGPGGTSATATVTVTTPPAGPTVSPSTATVDQLATRQLTATNFTGGSVNWSTSDATVATVSGSGLVTARAKAGTATVTARGVSDNTQSSTCVVTVPAVAVSISPTSAALQGGAAQQFTATVTGTTNTAVTWSNTGAGTVGGTGLYTAPGSQGSDAVTATSQADPTRAATAAIAITDLVAIMTDADLTQSYSGLAGTVGYTVYAPDGTTFQARTTAGIHEPGAGTGAYFGTFQGEPDTWYAVIWDTGGSSPVLTRIDRCFRPSSPITAGLLLSSAGVDEILVEPGQNLRQAISIIQAAVIGILSGAAPGASGTILVRNPAGTADRASVDVDGIGNRTSVTLTPPA